MSTVTVGCKYPSGVLMVVGSTEIKINGSTSSEIYGGHGITDDVPEDIWNAWLEQNKNHTLVTGGFIFAHEKRSNAKAEAKEKASNKTKAEALDKPKDNQV